MQFNEHILSDEVQAYIAQHLKSDTAQISLSKSTFKNVSGAELATQIASKAKAEKKLPTLFKTPGIYYPSPLSIEQTSSETTAKHKATLLNGKLLLDLTMGWGVDCLHFSKQFENVVGVERQETLAHIVAHNVNVLGVTNMKIVHGDGMDYLNQTDAQFDAIYVDPARRNTSGKVFKLSDCEPDITKNLGLILSKCKAFMIKTSPLLDITAGLKELPFVKEIHIISVKNECKELLWILEKDWKDKPKIVATTLNNTKKHFVVGAEAMDSQKPQNAPFSFLYEPDAALLKTGAFQDIGNQYNLYKLDSHTQLYYSNQYVPEFPGRIFKIAGKISAKDLKKGRDYSGNVIVRNYPDKAEQLAKKYKIKPSKSGFLIFTKEAHQGNIILETELLQYY